jgi:hypothetical protein
MRGLLYHGWQAVRPHRRPALVVLAMAGILLALASVSTCKAQTIANALAQVNARRAQLGLYALLPDPRLQAAAEYDAAWRAYRGHSGHLSWTPMPGRAEGVGWSSSNDPYGRSFHSCYHTSGRGSPPYTRSHRYAGAAVATGRGGTQYTLILR